jgi:myxalamid-type polyketide synthase MxaB
VLAFEHSELHCTCLDLEALTTSSDAALLYSEVTSGDTQENQLAYRQGQRYGARLVRYRAVALANTSDRLEIPNQPFQVRIRDYGLLESLRCIPLERLTPGPDEVEIQVQTVGLNFRDVLNALGMLQEFTASMGITNTADLPFGGECAGIITAVGTNVNHLSVGEAVIAAQTIGSLSSHVLVPAAFVVPKPTSLSFAEAATIPTAFLTAYYGLHHRAKLRVGERLLVHSAAGGVGQAAVQVAQWLGAEVWGTASPSKWPQLKATGVKQVFNSRTTDFAKEIATLTQEAGVDVVLNSLNGEFIPKSLDCLGKDGRFVEIGKLGIWDAQQMAQSRSDVAYHPFDLLDISLENPNAISELLQELMGLFSQGALSPLPHTQFPLENLVDAFRYMAQAKHVGKVVISITTTVPSAEAAPEAAPGALAIHPEATYLITGGLGALGLQVARWLVDQGARHLVLSGRRSPSSTATSVLTDLTQRGANLQVAATDISQASEVAALITQLKAQHPPLKGIFHAAGLLDDGMVSGQTWERFERVMAPKISGTWLLHQHTQGLDLDYFVCFSSVSALIGSPGQANYAAANAFMDALATYRRRLGLAGLSINWGPWSQSGMAAALQSRDQARWEAQGVSLIAPEQGLALLGQLLAGSAVAQVAVLPVDWPRYLTQMPTGLNLSLLSQLTDALPAAEAQPPWLRLEWEQTPAAERQDWLTQQMQSLIAKVLGLDSPTLVQPRQRLFDLGIDSLMAVELKSRLEAGLGCGLRSTLIFDYPTVEALVGYLATDVLSQSPSLIEPPASLRAKPSVPDPEVKEFGLDELEALSEEEAEALLLAELENVTRYITT